MLVWGLSASQVWAQTRDPVSAYEVQGDAIVLPLKGLTGDVQRGRTIVASRQRGLCLLCHSGPFPEETFQGNLAPDLQGAGRRWSAAQLRLRLVDSRRVNPNSIMPAYHRTQGLSRVGAAWREQPLLNAQEIEDVVAYLVTLRD
jgi:sulfur-oxidizing protein SoxX